MMRQLAILWIGCATIGLTLAGAGWLLAGGIGLVDASIACVLCLVPMTATMIWCERAFALRTANAPEQQLMAVLGGTGLRMLVVLAGGITLFHTVEALHRPAFLLMVVVFYLATLTLEIILVVRRQNRLADERASHPNQS
jgi:hypothetical protein